MGKYVQRSLEIGLHILSEKPIAMTSTDGIKLINLYRASDRTQKGLWHVAENYRLEPSVQYCSKIVKEYHIRPKTFALTCLRQQSTTSKYAVTTWRAKPEYNGSFVLDGGIHFIALMRTIFGVDSDIHDINGCYEENSVVECGTLGTCRIGNASGIDSYSIIHNTLFIFIFTIIYFIYLL